MRKLLALLAALALTSCSGTALSDHDFIVEVHDQGQWLPTAAQAAEAKAALTTYLATTHDAYPFWGPSSGLVRQEIQTKISDYYLQYYGLFFDLKRRQPANSGDKEILINGLCQKQPPDPAGYTLSTNLMFVNDGGWCFFHADYSLEQRKIVLFAVNGKA